MPIFDDFLKALKDNLVDTARDQLQEHAEAFVKDGEDFAEETKDDLEDWTKDLAAGNMSLVGCELAVRGKADLAKMEALKQAGLAAIRIDKLKAAILDTVVNTASTVFLP